MPTYDFETPIERRGTHTVKYDLLKPLFGNPDSIPLWVADMDLKTPDFIVDTLANRLTHPILGYTLTDKGYENAIIDWYYRRHGWKPEKEWIGYCAGVVAGLNHAVRGLTSEGDKIIIQTPVYPPFYATVRNNGRQLLENRLVENDGYYSIDFDNLEELAQQGAKMLILCSPHNPVGRVWSRGELERVADICLRNNVLILSDEIHGDLTLPGQKHIPMASLSAAVADRTLTFASASKTFNIAGLYCGFCLISNVELMRLYRAELTRSGADHANIFGVEALKAAFTPQGEEWLAHLARHLDANADFVAATLARDLPGVTVRKPQGTYLLWLDFRSLGLDDDTLDRLLVHEAGVAMNPGRDFGDAGAGFRRMNVACPRQTLATALERMAKVLSPYLK